MPAWTVPAAWVISGVIVAGGLVVPVILAGRHGVEADHVRRAAGFETSHGVAVWWASVLFLLAAALAYGESERRRRDSDSIARRWAVVATVLVWLSFDHAVHFHVAVGRLVGQIGIPAWVDPVAVVLMVAVGVAGVPLLRAATPRRRPHLVGAAFLVVIGGWGVDAAVALMTHPTTSSRGLESACEWAGLVWFAWLVVRGDSWVLEGEAAGSRGRFGPPPGRG